MKNFLSALFLALWCATAQAQSVQTVNPLPLPDANFQTNLQNFLKYEDANRYAEQGFPSIVVTGGTHATGAGLTKTPGTLIAYPGGYRITETGSITYQASRTCYVIANNFITGNAGSFVRVAGTHYLIDCASSSEPTLPTNSVRLMTVVTDGSSVTTVTDRRTTSISIGGGGGVAGTNTQVQFNDNGVMAGDSGFTFDKNTDTVTAGRFVGPLTGLASTATAFPSNPANCPSGQVAAGIAADGSAEGCVGTSPPGGSNTNVQFNDAGTFGGDAGLSYNKATDVLTVTGGVVSNLTGGVTGNVTGNVSGNAGTATSLAANPNDCSPGQAPSGITANGTAENCFDVTTQAEMNAHTAGTGSTVHGATSTNTGDAIVTRDVSGNFSAGTITAATTGTHTGAVVGNASTATALAANGTNCAAGQAASGVDASGNSEGCIVVGSGAGVPVVLDLGDNGSSESGDLAKITTSGDTNNVFTEPNADELHINVGAKWPAANTADTATAATALSANGANCSAGSFPLGVDASGAAEGCTSAVTGITGTANQITASASTGAVTLSIPTNPTLPGTTTGTFSGNLTGSVAGNVSGNATTATSLAANGTNCSVGQAAAGVDAQGNAEGCSTVLATPGGSDTHVQFNDAGTLNGDSGLTYNKSTDVLTAVGGFVGNLTGNASTATALAANPTDCGGGQFATAIAANGNLTCSTPAGGGDVTGPASSTDSKIALFNSTTGKLLKEATQTGILTGTAGVIGTATAGVDYVAPAGNVATATSLAANGGNCTAGQAPLGVNAQGIVEGCTDYLEEPASAGIVTKTAVNTSVARTITGTLPVTVTQGNGVAGDPAIACPTCAPITGSLSQFASTTSAQLAGVISNETGTGALVFGTSPTLTTPVIADYTTAQHTHATAAQGGKITPSTGLNATGTPSASTFINGANAWATPTAGAGGSTSQMQYNNAGAIAGVIGCTSDGTSQTCGTDQLRFTNPRATSGIRDTNGNLWVSAVATPSAVNAITVTNAAAGGTPSIVASGSDTNVGLNIAGQGAGVICIGTSCATAATTIGTLEIGTLKQNGTTSGTISFLAQAAAGTYNFNWPTTAGTNGQCLISGGGGSTANTWGTCGGGGGGSASFDAITNGTNTTAAMVVGTGSSLTYTGSGTINATTINGGAVAPIAVDKTVAPATSDNTAGGYPNGSMWIDNTSNPDRPYLKTNETTGTALWGELAMVGHAHSAADVTSGVGALARGFTNQSSWTASRCVQVNSGGTALESASAACGTGVGGGTSGPMNTATANGAPNTAISTTETQINTVSITPNATTSKILILARAEHTKDVSTTVRTVTTRVRRGTTNSDPLVSQVSSINSINVASSLALGPAVILAIDSPSTTSATTYRLSAQTAAGAVTTAQYELQAIELTGSGFAAASNTYWTSQAETGLSAETNLGALTTGMLKHTVSGSVSTPATATAGTDYSSPSSTESLTNKTFDAEGTGNVVTMPFKLWLPAAGGTAAAPASVWNLPAINPAVAVVTAGTNTLQGTLDFADGGAELSAQLDWMLPSDWAGAVDARLKWFTTATSGDVVWKLSTSCVADAETNDPAFNTSSNVTDTAKGTTLQTNDATITGVTMTGCAAGELLHLKVARDPTNGSDTLAATARLIGVELTYRRAM